MIVLLALLFACAGDASSDAAVTAPPVATVVAPVPAAETPPADAGAAAPPRVPATTTRRIAASHILVSYQGAVNALPNVTRTREEARARAEEARAKILAGADFAATARGYSDDATGARGGSLGGFDDGTMVKPFEDAAKALPIGGVSELVETPFGFHIIRREALAEVHEQHLLVSWAGAERAPAGVTRTQAAAKARMDEAVEKLGSGMSWDEVVQKYSDGPLKEDGGDLGWFGRGQLAPALDVAAFDLDIGATSPVVESPRGYHLLHRQE
jgi:parvulin-like peptidyl-prolyl isomerase